MNRPRTFSTVVTADSGTARVGDPGNGQDNVDIFPWLQLSLSVSDFEADSDRSGGFVRHRRQIGQGGGDGVGLFGDDGALVSFFEGARLFDRQIGEDPDAAGIDDFKQLVSWRHALSADRMLCDDRAGDRSRQGVSMAFIVPALLQLSQLRVREPHIDELFANMLIAGAGFEIASLVFDEFFLRHDVFRAQFLRSPKAVLRDIGLSFRSQGILQSTDRAAELRMAASA
jgi:hypothetical protein